MTDIYLHNFARMADYIHTHPYSGSAYMHALMTDPMDMVQTCAAKVAEQVAKRPERPGYAQSTLCGGWFP